VPAGLTATASAPDRVDLAWQPSTDDKGVTGYRVYRDGALLATLAGTGTTYSDASVAPATTYRYQVSAVDAAGNQSTRSASVSATTPGPPDREPPSAPGDLVATASSSIAVQLTWTPSQDNVGVAAYRIYHDGGLIGTAPAEATSYVDDAESPTASCVYAVSAVDDAGNESPRATVTACTPPSLSPLSVAPPVPAPAPGSAVSPAGRTACSVKAAGRRRHLLLGTAAGDTLLGRGGNDRLEGFAGGDCLFGLAGRDVLRGGSGDDRLFGGAGRDRLYGGRGSDRLSGGSGNDRLSGGTGRDRLLGGTGRDVIDARDGRPDIVDCGRGRDTARVDPYDRVRHCEKLVLTR
jgi:chitodextrinase